MIHISNLRAARDTLYNRVWHNPKGKLSAKLKTACDNMPYGRRVTVVSLMLTVFILTAFFVFGHACYRMGMGHSRQALELEHIRTIELPATCDEVEPLAPSAYDDAGMESED